MAGLASQQEIWVRKDKVNLVYRNLSFPTSKFGTVVIYTTIQKMKQVSTHEWHLYV